MKLEQLIDDSEELLTKLADAHDPDIQKLRDRVDQAISDARRSFERQGADASDQLRDWANDIDGYVRDNPWLAVTTGVVVAAAVAFLAGTAVGSRK